MLVALLKNINFGLTYQQPKKATPTLMKLSDYSTKWKHPSKLRKCKKRKEEILIHKMSGFSIAKPLPR
jgi:hypothetical protein